MTTKDAALPPTGHDPLTAGALLSAVSDNTNDMIFVKSCEGRMLFANPATLRELGKTREQTINRTSRELLALAEEAERIDRDDRRVMQERTPLTAEHTLHLTSGVRTFSTTRSPWIDADGVLRGVVGISTDITARKQAEDSLRARELQLEATIAERTTALRELTNHIETIREEEKRAIARELHDDMGATLTSLSMHLQSAYTLFPQEEKWVARKAKIQALLSDLVASTRRMQTSLRPTMLDLFGLKTAIGELATDFSKQSGLPCRISLPDEDLPMQDRRDIALYRMLQEILNNVVKHAHATRVDIILDMTDHELALTVRDDGVGIPPERLDNATTYGLRGLRERAAFLGGAIAIRAPTGGGTVVAITVPLADIPQA